VEREDRLKAGLPTGYAFVCSPAFRRSGLIFPPFAAWRRFSAATPPVVRRTADRGPSPVLPPSRSIENGLGSTAGPRGTWEDPVRFGVPIPLPPFLCQCSFRAAEKTLAEEWGQRNEERTWSVLLRLNCSVSISRFDIPFPRGRMRARRRAMSSHQPCAPPGATSWQHAASPPRSGPLACRAGLRPDPCFTRLQVMNQQRVT